ncbi:hypothetical protein [Denitratisoma oestradiolicum]|nr:hypothetical protein [Denitratisoma oestradiolicum]
MGKARQSNKEAKKQPLLTPKEKKHAKHVKKHAHDEHAQDVVHTLIVR